jgi:hypothetical protein
MNNSTCDHPRPDDAELIHRGDFDELARDRSLWSDGPWLSSFGDGPGEPYIPQRQRSVWGRLKDGRAVWSKGED